MQPPFLKLKYCLKITNVLFMSVLSFVDTKRLL